MYAGQAHRRARRARRARRGMMFAPDLVGTSDRSPSGCTRTPGSGRSTRSRSRCRSASSTTTTCRSSPTSPPGSAPHSAGGHPADTGSPVPVGEESASGALALLRTPSRLPAADRGPGPLLHRELPQPGGAHAPRRGDHRPGAGGRGAPARGRRRTGAGQPADGRRQRPVRPPARDDRAASCCRPGCSPRSPWPCRRWRCCSRSWARAPWPGRCSSRPPGRRSRRWSPAATWRPPTRPSASG